MKILAMGKCVPRQILDNEALSHMVETNDEWITSRTGIRQRRIAKDETVVSMAAEAARQAMERAGTRPGEIGLVLVCTFTPDLATPSVACLVQRELGLPQEILAYDLNAACSGFIYGLVTAEALLSGMEPGKKALIIGAEVISRTVDYTDRGTCILFGDGAGAAVAVASEDKLTADWGASGDREVLSAGQLLPDGSRTPLAMNGKEVFRFAVSTVPKSITRLLEKAGVPLSDVDHIVCHQANHRIVEGIAKHLHTDLSRFYENIEFYGKTSAASIPIALCDMQEQELLHRGERMVLAGFGSGLTWGSVLMNW